jgi:mRNA interferase MazF
MPVRFPPKPRSLLICDYSLGGFRAPEMVKRRPVIVLVGSLPRRSGLAAVVPLSTTPPPEDLPYIVGLRIEGGLPHPFSAELCWAKCDMVATVALERLDLFRLPRDPSTGLRRYLSTLRVQQPDFQRVQAGVLAGLGIAPVPQGSATSLASGT